MITKLKLIMMLSALNSTINMIDAYGYSSPQGGEITKSENKSLIGSFIIDF